MTATPAILPSERAAELFMAAVTLHGADAVERWIGRPQLPPMPPPPAADERIPKPRLSDAALYGAIGDWVRLVEPHTEASRPALLASAAVAVGALVGRSPSVTLDGARHGVNLFALLVGATSNARKGTAVEWGAERLLRALDPDFLHGNIGSGLATGQGLIFHVRDARQSSAGSKILDEGVPDKRLLAIEPEFAGPLRQARGRENILSTTLRQAWDGKRLRTLVKTDPLTATNPHIAIIAQITPEELRTHIEQVDITSGFINRFLLVHTERARVLPFGSEPDARDEGAVIERLRASVYTARAGGAIDRFTPAAHELWGAEYSRLTAARGGRVGAATQRAAPQVRRIALLYAALDGASVLDLPHLEAAIAMWAFSEGSARWVFGPSELSPRAKKIASALLDAGPEGLDRTALRERVLHSGNVSAGELDALEAEMADMGILHVEEVATAGRPRTVWIHREHGRNGRYGRKDHDLGQLSTIPTISTRAGDYERDERTALEAGL